MVFDVHSFGRKRSTTARASASSSTLNEEATHEKRLSQLHPPLIQAFFSCSNTANSAADEPARASMSENIAENCLDRQVLRKRPESKQFLWPAAALRPGEISRNGCPPGSNSRRWAARACPSHAPAPGSLPAEIRLERRLQLVGHLL